MSTELPILLAPLSELLAAFNHRHKNQHRRSAWWSHFNLLRRCVRRLLLLSSGAQAVRKPAAQASLTCHARWASKHIISPSYIAFTQLTADNQFAPLGLLLLGILARFRAAIFPLLAPASIHSPAAKDLALDEGGKLSVAAESVQDLGETISRDDFPIPVAPQRQESGAPSLELNTTTSAPVKPAPTPVEASARDNKGKEKVKKKKRKKAIASTDMSDIFGSLA